MATKKKCKLCKLCNQRPAAVPDRESASPVWRPAVCRECHAARLAGDMAKVVAGTLRPKTGGKS